MANANENKNVDERSLTIEKDGEKSLEVKFNDLDKESKILFNKVWLIKKEKDNFIADTSFRIEQLGILEKSYLGLLTEKIEPKDGEEKNRAEPTSKD
jgi:hypothetical protein